MKRWLAGVLCAGMWLACAQPPRVPLRLPEPPQVFTTACNDLHVQFILEKNRGSAPTYKLQITDQSGQPLAEDARVILAFTSVGTNISTTTVVAQVKGESYYGPGGGFTLTPGAWKVEVIVRRDNEAETVCMFAFSV